MDPLKLESKLTCPHCGHESVEIMPTNACQYFYQCPGCDVVLSPGNDDCCVFCSFGSVPCPPIQQQKRCCRQPFDGDRSLL